MTIPAPYLDPRWMTLREAADFLGICTRSLINRTNAGRIACSQEHRGAARFYLRADVERYRDQFYQAANVQPMRRRRP